MVLAGGSLGDLEETLIRTSGSRASSRAFRDRSLFIAWGGGGGGGGGGGFGAKKGKI